MAHEWNFRVWAPKATTVSIIVDSKTEYPMVKQDGFFSATLQSDAPVDYLYVIDGEKQRPDPCSSFQPYGVHGPSRTYDHDAFVWEDSDWQPILKKDYIIYELHVGTFTPEGTFDAIIDKLAYLKDLGITSIELMPVIEFPGEHNWGYDGTYPYAPHHSYGGPDGLKRLINASHKMGLAVIIDVVYNHLGPEGNYLADFGYYFTDRYKTPWGEAVNYDGPYSDYVREYVINNALYWVEHFHVDALRLDAIHAIFDQSAKHILQELKETFEKRQIKSYLFVESDLNDTRVLTDYALDAQWSDGFHHAIHALITGDYHSYFQDFGSIGDLAKAYTTGFVYDGKYSRFRKKKFGSSSAACLGDQFIVNLQNHDQIGNGSRGRRIHTLMTKEQYRLATMLLFFSPYIPLLFMGQEWAASTPFFYFTSFEDADLVRNIYQAYVKEHHAEQLDFDTFNSQTQEAFFASKINWKELHEPWAQEIHSFYRELIQLRKETPCLSNCSKEQTKTWFDEENKWLIVMRTDDKTSSKAVLVANFSPNEQIIPLPSQVQGKWLLHGQGGITLDKNVHTNGYTALLFWRRPHSACKNLLSFLKEW
ncbi:MAG: malto-oligosyltrehalose trehalohydrolase [Verrucomicrobia bacterium]|nr:malto-oligosyltrehalose trehalohydrolase [Verrucomicrobiota bacterium]